MGAKVAAGGEEMVVVVLMEKGWRQVVAVLGILRCAGAYLPMDPKVGSENDTIYST